MDKNDPLGLYRALGVTPTATVEEIAAAFRKRSKETHPDTSGRESAEEFVQVSAAYEVLGDPARREKYDRSSWEPFKREAEVGSERAQDCESSNASSAPRLDPIHCNFCGRITAQPRHLTFSYLIGLVFRPYFHHASGIFCTRCARLKAVFYSLITMLTGWWLFPAGPRLTILTILQNGFETERIKTEDEGMILHNAFAFLSHGNPKLAYALANSVKNSGDISISRQSETLLREIEQSGAEYHSSVLANAWGKSFLWDLSHVIIASIMPICLGVATYNYVGREFDRLQDEKLFPRVAKADPSLCKNPPRNGQAIGPQSAANPGHSVSIRNESPYKMIVKLRDIHSGRVAAALFVDSGMEAWAHPVPSGDYMIQYAAGEGFDANCSNFVQFYGINALNAEVNLRSYNMKNGGVFMPARNYFIDNIHDYEERTSNGRFSKTYHYKTFFVYEFNEP